MVDLKRLKELEAKATKGEWRIAKGYVGAERHEFLVRGDSDGIRIWDDETRADFELCAALRNAAPELIALAEWAKKAKEALQFIGCKKDQYRGCSTDCGPYVGLCDRCDLLKSYPGGQQ